jgi:hypothetical protein
MAYKVRRGSTDPVPQDLQDYQLAYNKENGKFFIKNADKNKIDTLFDPKATEINENDFFGHENELPDGQYAVHGLDSIIHYFPHNITQVDKLRATMLSETNGEPVQLGGSVGQGFWSSFSQDANFFYGVYCGANWYSAGVGAVSKTTKQFQFIEFPSTLRLTATRSGGASGWAWPAQGGSSTSYYCRTILSNPNNNDVYLLMRQITYTNPSGTVITTAATQDTKIARVSSSGQTVTITDLGAIPGSVWQGFDKYNLSNNRGSNKMRFKHGITNIGNSYFLFPSGTNATMGVTKVLKLSGNTITQIDVSSILTLPTDATDKNPPMTVTNDGSYISFFNYYGDNATYLAGNTKLGILNEAGALTSITLNADALACMKNSVAPATYYCWVNKNNHTRVQIAGIFVKNANNADVIRYNKIVVYDLDALTQAVVTLPEEVSKYSDLPLWGPQGTEWEVPVDNETTPTKYYLIYSHDSKIVTFNIANNAVSITRLAGKRNSTTYNQILRIVDGYVYCIYSASPSVLIIIKLSDLTVEIQPIPYCTQVGDIGFLRDKIVAYCYSYADIGYASSATTWAAGNYMRPPAAMPYKLTINRTTRKIEKIEQWGSGWSSAGGASYTYTPEYSSNFRAVFTYPTGSQAWNGTYNLQISDNPLDVQNWPLITPASHVKEPEKWKFSDGSYFNGFNGLWTAVLKKEPVTVIYEKVGNYIRNLNHPLQEITETGVV